MAHLYGRRLKPAMGGIFILIFSLCSFISLGQLSFSNHYIMKRPPLPATLSWEMNYTDPVDDIWLHNASVDHFPCPSENFNGSVDIRSVTLLNNTVPNNYTALLYLSDVIEPTDSGLDFRVKLYYKYVEVGYEDEGFVQMEGSSYSDYFLCSAYHWQGTTQQEITSGAGYLSTDGFYFNWTFPKNWIPERDPDSNLITQFRMEAYSELDKTSAPTYTIYDNITNAQFSYIFPAGNGGGNGGSGDGGGDGDGGDGTGDFPWVWVGVGIAAGAAAVLLGVVIRQKRRKIST